MSERPRPNSQQRPGGVGGSIEKKGGYPSAPNIATPPKPPASGGPGAPRTTGKPRP